MSEKIKSIRFALVSMLLFFCAAVQAQTISGNVKDKSGEPIIGATVMEQGAGGNGTVTDFDGNFTLKLKGKASKLVFSYVGMQSKTVDTKGKSTLNVTLQDDAQNLDELIVTGYTTVRKKDLTGAVSHVGAKQIEDIPVSNVAEALTGKMAGVNVTSTEGSPDAEVNIRVRGGGSLSQDNSPLYIVDGFEVSSINDVASSDIESIDVLKDAASTAIYGARGANGVVIITTKGGTSDSKAEKKVNINFNASYGWKNVVKSLGVMDPYNFGYYQYEIASSSQFATDKSNYGAYSELGQLKAKTGRDWQEELFGNVGLQRKYDISVNGGTKKLNYNVSFAHDDQDAIMLGSTYSRNNVTAKLGSKLSKWVSLDFKFALSNQHVKGLGTGTDANESNATNSWSNQALRYAPIQAFSGGDDEDEENNTSNRVDPVTRVNGTYKDVHTFKHNYNLSLTWRPWKGWTFKTGASVGWANKDTDQAWTAIANRNSKYPGSGMGATVFDTDKKWSLTNTNTASYNKKKFLFEEDNFMALIGHEYKITTEKATEDVYYNYPTNYNTFDLLLNNTNVATSMNPYYFNSLDDKMNSFFGQFSYTMFDKYTVDFTIRADGSSKFGAGNRWGVFPAVKGGWRISDEKFMKNAEWVSNLKLRLSWGMSGNNRIDNGLIQTQYKLSGNTGTAPYFNETRTDYLTTNGYLYNPDLKWETTITRNVGIDYGFFKGRWNGTIDLYWNSTNDLLMKSRVQSSSGYLYQYQNFGSTENKGVEFTTNVVVIDKKNFRLNFNANVAYNHNKITKLNSGDPYQSSSFAGSTISEYNDFYVEEGGRLGEVYGFQYAGYYTASELGFDEANNCWGTKKDGSSTYTDANGKVLVYSGTLYPGAPKYVDQNGDGKIDANDKVRLGNTIPTVTGGFGLDASIKGNWGTIDAAVFFNYSLGNKILNGTKLANSFYAGSSAGWNLISDFNVDNRYSWIDPATGLNLGRPSASTVTAYGGAAAIIARLDELNNGKAMWNPASTTAMVISDWALEDADFLRLQNVTIGYTLPKAVLKKIHLQKIRVYFTGYNLACITGYSGYDPEVSVSKNAMCPGVDFATYPKSRSYTVGVNVQF